MVWRYSLPHHGGVACSVWNSGAAQGGDTAFRPQAIVGALFAMIATAAFAQWDTMYQGAQLQSSSKIYAPNLRGMWTEDMRARLGPEDQQALAGVQLVSPLVGAHGHPLDYYADVAARRIYIPILSVRFLDDLAIAQSWMIHRACAQPALIDYVAMLRHRNPAEFPGGRYPTPREALRVPDDVLKIGYVDDLSGKILKSTVFFLIAHEAAHIRLGHRTYGQLTPEQAQAQEMQADSFALDVMQLVGVPPNGLPLFFTTAYAFEPAPSDFASPAAYEAHRRSVTHPVTTDRLLAIAHRMQSQAARFAHAEPDPAKVTRIVFEGGAQVALLAGNLQDVKLKEFQKLRGRSVDLPTLHSACP